MTSIYVRCAPLMVWVLLFGIGMFGSVCGVYELCSLHAALQPGVLPIFNPLVAATLAALPGALMRIYAYPSLSTLMFEGVWILLLLGVLTNVSNNASSSFGPIVSVTDIALAIGVLYSVLCLCALSISVLSHKELY